MADSPPVQKRLQTSKSRASTDSDSDFGTEQQKKVRAALDHPVVENSMAFVIVLNFLLIIQETDITASEDSVPTWITVLSWLVLVLFVAELCLKLYSEEKRFFRENWNIFDLAVISIDLCFSILAFLFEGLFPISLLRILRLGKVARASKVFMLFPELRLMLAALVGSCRAIFWGTVLVFASLLLVSVIAVQFIHPLAQELDEKGVFDGCDRCGRAFSTVIGSTLTFSQHILAGDSWGTVTIPIIEHYPWTALYFGAVWLLIGMALWNLILGVVVDVAQGTRRDLSAQLEKEKEIERKESQINLVDLFAAMDTDHSNDLTKDELFNGAKDNEVFQQSMRSLKISKDDMEIIWHILDTEHTGKVDYVDFADELYSLRSSDVNFMITYIKHYITIIKEIILDDMHAMGERVRHIEDMTEHIEEHQVESPEPANLAIDPIRAPPPDVDAVKAKGNNKLKVGMKSKKRKEGLNKSEATTGDSPAPRPTGTDLTDLPTEASPQPQSGSERGVDALGI